MIIKITGYFKRLLSDLLDLWHLIRFGYPQQVIRFKILWGLTQGLIYPLPRILFGVERTSKICDSFLWNRLSSAILPLGRASKTKIMLSREPSHYQVYIEIYVKDLYQVKEIKKGMNVIDIGAHIGAYTMLAAEKVGREGRVVAVEPEPKNYEQLLKNIRLNNFKNVIPIKIALSDHEGSKKLYLHPFISADHSLVFKKEEGFKENNYSKVPVKKMDNLVSELNLNKVNIIKIDTEGAELSVLRGAEKTLKTNPGMKIIVASYHYPKEIKEVSQFLNERGFKTKIWKKINVITV